MKRSQQREWVFKLIYEDSINKISDVEKALAYHGLEDEDFIRGSINSYNEKKSSFKNWCAAVSKYKAIDLLRRESKFEAILLDENSASKDSDVHSNLEIEEALSALNDEDKKLFENIFIRGLSYGEAASEQHISTENAYQKVSRARKLLKRWRGENV